MSRRCFSLCPPRNTTTCLAKRSRRFAMVSKWAVRSVITTGERPTSRAHKNRFRARLHRQQSVLPAPENNHHADNDHGACDTQQHYGDGRRFGTCIEVNAFPQFSRQGLHRQVAEKDRSDRFIEREKHRKQSSDSEARKEQGENDRSKDAPWIRAKACCCKGQPRIDGTKCCRRHQVNYWEDQNSMSDDDPCLGIYQSHTREGQIGT